jgi:glutamate racemase
MIGIFDSGSGGLSVLRTLHARAPMLDVVYFGDLKNMPYGSKSQSELLELTEQAIQVLQKAGATQIVSACNSVSASVVRVTPAMENIIEMVGPAVRSIKHNKVLHVAVAATPATVESGMYQKEFERVGIRATMISCPELAAAIEREDTIMAQQIIDDVVVRAIATGADALLLACTHYPLVREMFGNKISVIDPADAVVDEIITRYGVNGKGTLKFLVSEKSISFQKRVENLFGMNNCIDCVTNS